MVSDETMKHVREKISRLDINKNIPKLDNVYTKSNSDYNYSISKKLDDLVARIKILKESGDKESNG